MSSMNSEIKDKAYHEELVREIEIKEARSLFLLQEIQYLKTLLKQVDLEEEFAKVSKELNTDIYTLEDITKSLILPLRDPRDELDAPILKSDILTLDDLRVGMELEGTVRNVVDFGAFVDIGLKNDGLVHISKISNERIRHPLDKLSIGDIVEVYVIDVDVKKHRVALSMIKN